MGLLRSLRRRDKDFNVREAYEFQTVSFQSILSILGWVNFLFLVIENDHLT